MCFDGFFNTIKILYYDAKININYQNKDGNIALHLIDFSHS